MSRAQNPDTNDEDTIRISFLLNVRREPELAYLLTLEGHGDRPRELLRLAKIGYQAEREMQELSKAVRRGGIQTLASQSASASPVRKTASEEMAASSAKPASSETDDGESGKASTQPASPRPGSVPFLA